MIAVIIISLCTCLIMMAVILFKPNLTIKGKSFPIFWIVPFLGAGILLCGHWISFDELWRGLSSDTTMNPFKILSLFLSMAILSIFLDEVGFFTYLANKTLLKAGNSQKRLFIYLYIIVSLLTIFTSNDIIILTFTPFICYFTKRAKISAVPFLFTEFVAANTCSMLLIIGNPTNIYLASNGGYNFLQYLTIMFLPTLLSGLTAFLCLYWLFRKKLNQPIHADIEKDEPINKPLVAIGLAHLILCTLLLVISNYLKLEMWLITLCFAISLLIFVTLYKILKKQKPIEIIACLKRAPWELIPFILSMFAIVLSLNKFGATAKIAEFLGNGSLSILKYGFASAIFANLINNIPMSVLFSGIVASYNTPALFACIIGSNLGAYLTPIGALAGIMWLSILKKNDVSLSFLQFVHYGLFVAIPTLFVSLGGLYLSFLILG